MKTRIVYRVRPDGTVAAFLGGAAGFAGQVCDGHVRWMESKLGKAEDADLPIEYAPLLMQEQAESGVRT